MSVTGKTGYDSWTRYTIDQYDPSSSTTPVFTGIPKPIYRYLDTLGNGTGIKNAIGDYSATPEIFYIQPAPGEIFRLTRMLILIRGDKSSFYTDSYGSRAELVNGISIRVQNDSGTVLDLEDGINVKANGSWGRLCFDAEIYPGSTGITDTYLRVRWTFERAGYPLRLVGDNNERLEIVLNDDFSLSTGTNNPLVEHYFMVQGYYEKE